MSDRPQGDALRSLLDASTLYVLLDGRHDAASFSQLAHSLVAAGVSVLQLRDKRLDDRRLLQRARLLRDATRDSRTLFVVNDRPDLALLAQADGVHVGQDELTVADCRRILGDQPLVGVSTHDPQQVREAVSAGADYLGCGPTFPSGTKSFCEFPGIPFLQQVAHDCPIPAFAIGGIGLHNASRVLDSGIRRIAVSRCVLEAADPAGTARRLIAQLVAAGAGRSP